MRRLSILIAPIAFALHGALVDERLDAATAKTGQRIAWESVR
jgi:hypothetical protein